MQQHQLTGCAPLLLDDDVDDDGVPCFLPVQTLSLQEVREKLLTILRSSLLVDGRMTSLSSRRAIHDLVILGCHLGDW